MQPAIHGLVQSLCSCSSLDVIHSFSIQKAFARLVQQLLLYGNAQPFSKSNSSYFVHFVHCLSLWCFILLHWVLIHSNSQALSEGKWQPKELQLQELHQGQDIQLYCQFLANSITLQSLHSSIKSPNSFCNYVNFRFHMFFYTNSILNYLDSGYFPWTLFK